MNREFVIANLCDDEADIQRLLGPIEASPSKYADGTIKTIPILRDYAKSLISNSVDKKVEELQKQVSIQQKQIATLQRQMKQLIYKFVDNESEMYDESDIESDIESDDESDDEPDNDSDDESDSDSDDDSDDESDDESDSD
jgi:hypothetical protein